MRSPALQCSAAIILLLTAACATMWTHEGGTQTLPEAVPRRAGPPSNPLESDVGGDFMLPGPSSLGVTLTLPDGWSSVMRGDDFVATRDGIFLQHVLVERIHIDQIDPSDGISLLNAFSAHLWPLRTVRYMTRRFSPDMSPADAAEVILASRANNPGLTDLQRQDVAMQSIAGHPGFKATFEFRLNVLGRKTPYRTTCYGFMLDEWFYGISYTAALRYYFEKDVGTFDAILLSFRLVDE